MKLKFGLTLISIFGVFAFVGAYKANASSNRVASKSELPAHKWHNSLAPKGDRTFDLNITQDGKPAFSILVPENANSLDKKAAELLAQALKLGCGIDFKVVSEDQYRGGSVISLGKTSLYKASGLKPSIDLDFEGYSIDAKDGNLFLVGGSRRGSISAAIALIEEDLGGRFYSHQEGLKMPELPDEAQIVLREYVPQFKVRTMFQSESFYEDYQLFNRVGALREKFSYVRDEWGGNSKLPEEWFVHTFDRLLPNKKYFKTHPEYFALIDGKRKPQGHGGGAQFCLTNEDARKIVLQKVLDELKTLYPSYKLFDVSPNDTHNSFCQCDKCMALQNKEGSASGPLLDLVNYIADEVAKVYPDVKITTLAYIETNKPPKHIRPSKNVIVRLANDTASAPYPMFYLEESDVFFPNMKNWIKLGAQLMIWDYVVDYKAWPMPRPNLAVIDHNINTYAKYGIYGLFLQSSHYGVGENQGKLRAWVYSKKMWDPSRKMSDLIRDFNYGYFGKAADLMQSYNDLLYNEWKQFHDNHTYKDSEKYPNKFCFSDKFYPTARAIFEKALELTKDDKALHDKVELEYISILFYRLQMMPPKEGDKADRAAYKADLDKFAKLTKRHKVEWISEGVTKTSDRIIEWMRQYGFKSDKPQKPITVKLSPNSISRCADGAEKVDDITQPGSLCIKLPIRSSEWSLQWWGVGNYLLNDVEYDIKVKVRADKKKNSGTAFACGIYSINKKKIAIETTIDAAKISDSGYSWIDCGRVNGSDTLAGYFYFAQIPDSSIDTLYISAVEIVPVKDDK